MVSGCWEKGDSNYERVNVTTIATIVFFHLYVCTRQKYSRQFVVFSFQALEVSLYLPRFSHLINTASFEGARHV
jgi:hypothetical protein